MAYFGAMSQMSAIERLSEHFGSQRSLAVALGIRPQSITKWKLNQIPAERVLEIERLCEGAVSRYEMRPDVFGEAPAA